MLFRIYFLGILYNTTTKIVTSAHTHFILVRFLNYFLFSWEIKHNFETSCILCQTITRKFNVFLKCFINLISDSIVIPNYLVPAMEHWGAIIYDEKSFLVDDSLTMHRRMIAVDRVIAHELAHQVISRYYFYPLMNIYIYETIKTEKLVHYEYLFSQHF